MIRGTQPPWRFVVLWGLVAAAAGLAAAKPVDYAEEIQPIFDRRCLECHGPQKQEAGLRLDSLSFLLKGGKSGPAVIAGKGFESLLYRGIAGASEDVAPMPPQGDRLTEKQIDLIRQWIDEGAKGKKTTKRAP
jgi:mono/diheme cytochrome c family protein